MLPHQLLMEVVSARRQVLEMLLAVEDALAGPRAFSLHGVLRGLHLF